MLDRLSRGSGSDLIKPWESPKATTKYPMLTRDQAATVPCTDAQASR